jgi:ABC-type phosphate transport system substrate-binding protein
MRISCFTVFQSMLSMAPLALALAASSGCAFERVGAPATKISLAGAQIPVDLVESWLNESQQQRFDIRRIGPTYLSQHGFDNLRDGLADVAVTDRPVGKLEFAALREKGKPVEGMRVGFYGFALYVNPQNTLDSMFAGHLKYLFQKKTTDWKELAPPGSKLEGPIRLIGPEKSTRGGELLMRQANIWFAQATWETKATDSQIVDAVANDPLALGFASLGFDQGVRYLALRMDRNGPPVLPSLEAIEDERYGLAKVIYVYYATPATPQVQAVLDYLFSPPGVAAIQSTSVWPLARERAKIEGPR